MCTEKRLDVPCLISLFVVPLIFQSSRACRALWRASVLQKLFIICSRGGGEESVLARKVGEDGGNPADRYMRTFHHDFTDVDMASIRGSTIMHRLHQSILLGPSGYHSRQV